MIKIVNGKHAKLTKLGHKKTKTIRCLKFYVLVKKTTGKIDY